MTMGRRLAGNSKMSSTPFVNHLIDKLQIILHLPTIGLKMENNFAWLFMIIISLLIHPIPIRL